MADTDTKLNPAEEVEAGTEPQKDEALTEKLTTGITGDSSEKTTTEKVTEKATAAGAAVKDNVFSMFGGGPKREKKEEEEVHEPSGSSKAKTEDEVGLYCTVFPIDR
jgi:Ran-binding protein 1